MRPLSLSIIQDRESENLWRVAWVLWVSKEQGRWEEAGLPRTILGCLNPPFTMSMCKSGSSII